MRSWTHESGLLPSLSALESERAMTASVRDDSRRSSMGARTRSTGRDRRAAVAAMGMGALGQSSGERAHAGLRGMCAGVVRSEKESALTVRVPEPGSRWSIEGGRRVEAEAVEERSARRRRWQQRRRQQQQLLSPPTARAAAAALLLSLSHSRAAVSGSSSGTAAVSLPHSCVCLCPLCPALLCNRFFPCPLVPSMPPSLPPSSPSSSSSSHRQPVASSGQLCLPD